MLNNKRTASIIAALFFLCHVPCTEVCADKNESLQWNEFQDDSVIWHYLFSPDSKEKPCENDAGVMAVAVKINGKKFNPICIPSDDDSNAPTADSIFTIDVNFDAAKDLVIIYSW
jgi:hypothetical protein